MKRITYNGGALVTGTAVAEALVHYVTRVAGMSSAVSVEVPVLAENGTVQLHTLILSAATQFDIIDVDGVEEEEAKRFPVPEFPPIGGEAVATTREELAREAPFIDEDPMDLADGFRV